MRVTELDLASEDVDVLREVVNREERGAKSGEINDVLGWVNENHQVTYRFDKLEERGLIETQQDASRGPSNQLPPRVAYPSDEGVELVEEIEYDGGDKDLEERVERIEEQLESMAEMYSEARSRIVELEERVDGHDEDLESVGEDLASLRRFLEDYD